MTTRLDGPLKRQITIGGTDYTLTITPVGLALVLKGRRKGFDLEWKDLVSGDAAMATALNASLTANLSAPERDGPRPASRRVPAKRSSRKAPAS